MPLKVLVLGHSFVRRLETDIINQVRPVLHPNLGLFDFFFLFMIHIQFYLPEFKSGENSTNDHLFNLIQFLQPENKMSNTARICSYRYYQYAIESTSFGTQFC
jgi:hypothetical protein